MRAYVNGFMKTVVIVAFLLFPALTLGENIDATLPDSDNSSSFQVKNTDSGTNTVLLNVQSGGNVGIGKTPADKLDVNGNVKVSGTNGRLVFPQSHYDTKIELYEAGEEKIGTAEHQLKLIAGDVSPANVGFFGGSTERMRVDTGSGNVGIGDTTPDANLEVVDDLYVSSTNAEGDNGDLFRVQNDGKVGVGTAAPNSTLHVGGSVALKRIEVSGSTGSTSGATIIGITTTSACTVTISAADCVAGRVIVIKDESGVYRDGNQGITIQSEGSKTIDGEGSKFFDYMSYICLTLYSDGSNWFIISKYEGSGGY